MRTLKHYFTELMVVFVGVALAFTVENLREAMNERSVGEQYLLGFRQDLQADLQMLRGQQRARQVQLRDAQTVLEFFDGRALEPQAFFAAYYNVLYALGTAPNRNTMDEVLNSGNLRLIRDAALRAALLDLYATYARIADSEAHMARDFDAYLYDPTFSTIPIQVAGPWPDSPENRQAVQALLAQVPIHNGMRLVVANLSFSPGGLIAELALATEQVEGLLGRLPEP